MSAEIATIEKVEAAVHERELGEGGPLIHMVESLEVGDEAPVLQEVEIGFLECPGGGIASVDGEYIAQLDRFLQPELHVEPEQESALPQLHHVTWHTIVSRCDPIRLQQLEFDRSKDVLSPLVQLCSSLAKRCGFGL